MRLATGTWRRDTIDAVSGDATDIARELTVLETDLKRLEAEYNMFFAGRLPKPPWETRARVDAIVKRLDRAHLPNYGDRFRFTTLQSRYAAFIDLWDRGLRAREEGRPGPFAHVRAAAPAPEARAAPRDRIVHVATLTDPAREEDKLHALYQSLSDARTEAGEERIPYQHFAELVKRQVDAMREHGTAEVAFRVAVKDGKVAFSARAMKGAKSS
jgi:hypothetical protein